MNPFSLDASSSLALALCVVCFASEELTFDLCDADTGCGELTVVVRFGWGGAEELLSDFACTASFGAEEVFLALVSAGSVAEEPSFDFGAAGSDEPTWKQASLGT